MFGGVYHFVADQNCSEPSELGTMSPIHMTWHMELHGAPTRCQHFSTWKTQSAEKAARSIEGVLDWNQPQPQPLSHLYSSKHACQRTSRRKHEPVEEPVAVSFPTWRTSLLPTKTWQTQSQSIFQFPNQTWTHLRNRGQHLNKITPYIIHQNRYKIVSYSIDSIDRMEWSI